MDALRAHSPRAVVLMAGLPPLWRFPVLPQPRRYVFGVRARTFDRLLELGGATRDRWFHVPTEFELSPDKFSDDGYHPSAESDRIWGEALAEWVVDRRATVEDDSG
ncbi:MAG: hypothetical protein OEQ13_12035 [Acidobacteriota bacterium]|nr:hypothetical protein [Acidobacteriota bacterium]